jgi:hypothetical protein
MPNWKSIRDDRCWLALVFIAWLGCVACSDGNLRGTFKASGDGNTYLAIVDDNGGHCGPLTVDGIVWRHAIGDAVRIEPGHHTISCGGEIEFDIPRGVVYKFDYWGP